MLSQRVKDLYFTLISPLAKLNYYRHRVSNWAVRESPLWLNIGSGAHPLKGFVNIEGNVFRKKDVWLDIRGGLPFADGSVDAIYASNVFEHFYMSELSGILRECRRVLKAEGVIRIVVPSLKKAIDAYTGKKAEWFGDFPAKYKSIGGKFFNSLLCDSQHRLIFDFSFMQEILRKNGFAKVQKAASGESEVFSKDDLSKMENDNFLIVESQKPYSCHSRESGNP